MSRKTIWTMFDKGTLTQWKEERTKTPIEKKKKKKAHDKNSRVSLKLRITESERR